MVGSFSGALLAEDSAEGIPPGSEFGRLVRQSRVSAFGPLGSPGRAAGDVTARVAKANPATTPYVYVACGTEDGLIAVNREFVAALRKQQIAYEYHESPGAHTFAYWDREIRPFLEVLAEHMPIRRPLGSRP
jgi:S-formylglutathione hydrolase FrmB